MKIVGIAFGVAVIGIIIAFIYEIKFTYRDGGLMEKVNDIKHKPYEK